MTRKATDGFLFFFASISSTTRRVSYKRERIQVHHLTKVIRTNTLEAVVVYLNRNNLGSTSICSFVHAHQQDLCPIRNSVK